MASPDLFLQWHLLYSGNICLPRPAVTRGLVVLVKDEEWVGCHQEELNARWKRGGCRPRKGKRNSWEGRHGRSVTPSRGFLSSLEKAAGGRGDCHFSSSWFHLMVWRLLHGTSLEVVSQKMASSFLLGGHVRLFLMVLSPSQYQKPQDLLRGLQLAVGCLWGAFGYLQA